MLASYLKIALRVLERQKLFSVINIAGLAIGLASFLLISLYIKDELTFDREFSKADRIYRLAANLHLETGPSIRAVTSPPMAGIVHNDIPEVEKIVRIGSSSRPLSYGDKTFFDIKLSTADSTFFDVFDFPFAAGDPATALKEPNSIVLTPKAAEKYFGKENPLGKTMILSDTIALLVTGVLTSGTEHAHLDFDCLYSRTTIVKPADEPKDNWFSNNFHTYLLLSPTADYHAVESKFPAMLDRHMGVDRKNNVWYELFLQPVTDIHLHSSLRGEAEANNTMRVIYTFGTIALFILLLASINFINLSTAKATRRANEVGVRKTAGAMQRQLIIQFQSESFLLTMISALLALVIVQMALPMFGILVGKNLSLNIWNDTWVLPGFIVITIVIGFLSGLYPAFLLSRFKPIQALKGSVQRDGSHTWLRKGLVVFQFTISIILIAGTIIVQNQIEFMQNQNLGFNKSQLVIIPVRGSEGTNRYETVKQKLLQQADVLSVSASAEPLGRGQSSIATLPEGWSGEKVTAVTTIMADHDFLRTHQIELVSGRDFSLENASDIDHAFIVNEAAVKVFGWKNSTEAIGKKLNWGLGKEGSVIGVVHDFHYFSLHKKVEPLIIHILPESFSYLTVRINPGHGSNWQASLSTLEKEWKALGMKGAFEYFFLDDDFDQQYKADKQLRSFIGYFSTLAIFIGCLGLFGLAAYTTEQRTKEIGIRRILGASPGRLAFYLSREFIQLVIAANLVAWPVSWYLLNQWLSGFATHIDISVFTLLLSGLIALIIASFTVGYESIKAALRNPVEALRRE